MRSGAFSLVVAGIVALALVGPARAGEQSVVLNNAGKTITVEVQGGRVNLAEGQRYEVRGSWGFSVTGPHTCIGGRYMDGSCAKSGPEFRCDYHDWNRRGQALERGLYTVRYTFDRRTRADAQQCTITRQYPYT